VKKQKLIVSSIDLSIFVETIKVTYASQALYYFNDRLLKCNENGSLYYVDDLCALDNKTAKKAWEFLYENQSKLLCFQPQLF